MRVTRLPTTSGGYFTEGMLAEEGVKWVSVAGHLRGDWSLGGPGRRSGQVIPGPSPFCSSSRQVSERVRRYIRTWHHLLQCGRECRRVDRREEGGGSPRLRSARLWPRRRATSGHRVRPWIRPRLTRWCPLSSSAQDLRKKGPSGMPEGEGDPAGGTETENRRTMQHPSRCPDPSPQGH